MVAFLDSDGIKSELSKILKRSEEFVYIVSPYLKIGDRYRAILKDIANQGKEIKIIYGKKPMNDSEMDWFKSVDMIGLYFWKDLHAKCYMNEKAAIITSLNLYEYSLINNYEMGIVIYRDQDTKIYDEILDEVHRLMRLSEEIKIPKRSVLGRMFSKNGEKPIPKLPTVGYCIRCEGNIPFNMERPYCDIHYKSWAKYKNLEYVEKKGVCHICGKKYAASMSKPICYDCYLEYKDVF